VAVGKPAGEEEEGKIIQGGLAAASFGEGEKKLSF
jgi:hypothetical protein